MNITMLERLEAAEKAHKVAEERHEDALREWDMTAKGRESLQEVADDETKSLPERVDAASRKEAAQHRASEQRGLRAPLEAEDLDDETKFAIANLNLRNSQAEVAVLRNRQAAIEQEMAAAKENMAAAKQAKNEEAMKQWQDRYAQLTIERNLNKRKIAQILSHIQKLEHHIAKMRAELMRKIDKIGVLSERGVRNAVQYLL